MKNYNRAENMHGKLTDKQKTTYNCSFSKIFAKWMYEFVNCKMYFTWSVIVYSTYSANAYPLLKPVAASLTKLNAFNCPKDNSSSLTCNRFN